MGGSVKAPQANPVYQQDFANDVTQSPQATQDLSGPVTTQNLTSPVAAPQSNIGPVQLSTDPVYSYSDFLNQGLNQEQSLAPYGLNVTQSNPLFSQNTQDVQNLNNATSLFADQIPGLWNYQDQYSQDQGNAGLAKYENEYYNLTAPSSLGAQNEANWLGGNSDSTFGATALASDNAQLQAGAFQQGAAYQNQVLNQDSTAENNYANDILGAYQTNVGNQATNLSANEQQISDLLNRRSSLYGNDVQNAFNASQLADQYTQNQNQDQLTNNAQQIQQALANNQLTESASAADQQNNLAALGLLNNYNLSAAGTMDQFGLGAAGQLNTMIQNQAQNSLYAQEATAANRDSLISGLFGLGGGAAGLALPSSSNSPSTGSFNSGSVTSGLSSPVSSSGSGSSGSISSGLSGSGFGGFSSLGDPGVTYAPSFLSQPGVYDPTGQVQSALNSLSSSLGTTTGLAY